MFQIYLMMATIALASCQRYQDDTNYLSELYADYEGPVGRPTPRSYAAAPVERQQPAGPKPTPVAILKQINRHNEDGSYTYGFEGADGSFKIETKAPNGEVKGKYGFVDDSGKVRVVEYGADKYGFQPSGEGITVAPPTLVDETTGKDGLALQDYDYQQPQPTARPQSILGHHHTRTQSAPAAYHPQFQSEQRYTQALFSPQTRPQYTSSGGEGARIAIPVNLQSQLIQNLYDDQPVASPASAAYKTGPVQFGPAPVHESQHQAIAVPRPIAQQSSGRGGTPRGILDQLARDYALPQNAAAPLHDISFGYY